MNSGLWLRFAAISTLFALLMTAAYLLVMQETTGATRDAIQRSTYVFVARLVEEAPYPESMQRIDALLAESPQLPAQLWVVDEHGRVLAQRTRDGGSDVPLQWLRDGRVPQAVHEVRILSRWLRGAPAAVVIRLRDSAPTYLVVRDLALPGRSILLQQTVLFVVTIGAAIFLGLTLVTLYLRGRSGQARDVLARMQAGDLRARFAPDRLDVLGRLMLDFNRMADEIERLVQRLHEAEAARRGLLQELGHDLRTPLTSLRTAAETLASHAAQMPACERDALAAIVRSELDYFVRLLDDLFFVAEIAEPRYRSGAERVDVAALLRADVQAVRARHGAGPQVALQAQAANVAGDPVLLSRVFRNAIDNAARHARTRVDVSAREVADAVQVTVADDGPGMSEAQIAAYGARRGQRIQARTGDPAMSLGLGSVIIRTIVELHHGRLHLNSSPQGTTLTITLPRSA